MLTLATPDTATTPTREDKERQYIQTVRLLMGRGQDLAQAVGTMIVAHLTAVQPVVALHLLLLDHTVGGREALVALVKSGEIELVQEDRGRYAPLRLSAASRETVYVRLRAADSRINRDVLREVTPPDLLWLATRHMTTASEWIEGRAARRARR